VPRFAVLYRKKQNSYFAKEAHAMNTIIAMDCHKHYTIASVETVDGRLVSEKRIEHRPGKIADFLRLYELGSPVAVETVGNWYWIVDEIESVGMLPRLVHARKAKLMLGSINKTDKLDARGLNKLQRCGTLPTVWIPPGDTRDRRELPRTRMVLSSQRTRLKNRISSVFTKYGLQWVFAEVSDIFGVKARKEHMQGALGDLPSHTRYCTEVLLGQLDQVSARIKDMELRMEREFSRDQQIELLMSMPGIGFILAVVILHEVGDISRFSDSERFASYSGTVPRVQASGGKVRYGKCRPDVNRYLKWAFVEAANAVVLNRYHYADRYVVGLYERVRFRRGHGRAIGAVARHLAESTYWVLCKRQGYLERGLGQFSRRRHEGVSLS
jgi:transposase